MVEIISLNQDENLSLEAIAYELSVLIPRYLETLDRIEAESDLDLFLCWLSNSFLYRQRLKKVFDCASQSSKEFSFEESMMQSLQVELEVLEIIYGELEDGKRFDSTSLMLIYEAKEQILEQMVCILCLLGIEEGNEDLQAIKQAQKILAREKLRLYVKDSDSETVSA